MDLSSRIILIVILLFLCAFFTLSESSVSYCNKIKIQTKAQDGSKSAKVALKLLDRFDNSIVTILIGTNIVSVLLSIITTILFTDILLDLKVSSADTLSALLSTIVSTILVFFIGEIIPKSLGKFRANHFILIVAYPLFIIDILLTPLSFIFKLIIRLLKKIFNVKDQKFNVTEDDFTDIIEDIEESGIIEEDESEIIQSAVDFDDLKVKEVMAEREKICAYDIDSNLTRDELIDYICSNNYSRIPVYKDSIDNIIGILHTRILLKVLIANKSYDINKLLVEPLIVTPNMHLDTIFDEFRKNKTHLAIVKDSQNKTLGLVTMEDVLEELVGDIDESDEGGANHE